MAVASTVTQMSAKISGKDVIASSLHLQILRRSHVIAHSTQTSGRSETAVMHQQWVKNEYIGVDC